MSDVKCILISNDKIAEKIEPFKALSIYKKKKDISEAIKLLEKESVHLIIIDTSLVTNPINEFFKSFDNSLENNKSIHIPSIFVVYDKADSELRSNIWQQTGVIGYSSKNSEETWRDIRQILNDIQTRLSIEKGNEEKIEIGSIEPIDSENYERLKFVSLTTGRMRDFMVEFTKLMKEVKTHVKEDDVFCGVPPDQWLDWVYYKDAPVHFGEEREENKKREKEIKEKIKNNNPLDVFHNIFCNQNAVAKGKRHHILIEGETGTGKSLLADMIARFSFKNVPPKNFQKITATNIPSNLLEGELFGYMRGSYTGANETRAGKLLKAYNGIVFIDEIGDLELKLQAKLLTFLDYGLIEPMGWNGPPIYVPVTVIAATNKNLLYMSRRGQFREDLYYRFSRRLYIPPLRERDGDMDVLVDFILQNPMINPIVGGKRRVNYITKRAIEKIRSHIFPGNFRELENLLLKAVENAKKYGCNTITDKDIVFGEITMEEHEAVFLIIKKNEEEKTKFLLRWDIPHKQYFFIGGRLEPDKEYFHQKALFREIYYKTGLTEDDLVLHNEQYFTFDSIQQPIQFPDKKLYHFRFYGLRSIKKDAWERLLKLEIALVTEEDIERLQYNNKKISPLVREVWRKCADKIKELPALSIE